VDDPRLGSDKSFSGLEEMSVQVAASRTEDRTVGPVGTLGRRHLVHVMTCFIPSVSLRSFCAPPPAPSFRFDWLLKDPNPTTRGPAAVYTVPSCATPA